MDNKKTLKKILEELNQDKPRIDYIKGMLEVLIGDEEQKYIPVSLPMTPVKTTPITALDPDLPPPPNFNNVIPPTND